MIDINNISFKDFFDIYMYDTENTLSNYTRRGRDSCVKTYMGAFKNMSLSAITPQIITEWQNDLFKTTGNKTGKLLSSATVKQIVTSAHVVFRHAVEVYGLENKPFLGVPKIKDVATAKAQYWTSEEFYYILGKIPQNDEMYTLIYETLFLTGMRIGELLAITPEDISYCKRLNSGTIRINKTIFFAKKQQIIVPPKTPSGNRNIDCPGELLAKLCDYAKHPSERIFKTYPQTVRAYLTELVQTQGDGLNYIKVHGLRHSHVAYLMHTKTNLLLIAERIGHSSPEVTLRQYGHFYPRESEVVARNLSELMEASNRNMKQESPPPQQFGVPATISSSPSTKKTPWWHQLPFHKHKT